MVASRGMRTGVLALQGGFDLHCRALQRLGEEACEVRTAAELAAVDRLIIPGGESTVIGRMLVQEGMADPIVARVRQGMPVWGTCAGMIVLCSEIEDSAQPRLGCIDATVRRNAFGRQVQSYEETLQFDGVGEVRGVFIRAPAIVRAGAQARVLARCRGFAVAVQSGSVLATAFHPELTQDDSVLRYFLRMTA